MAEWGAIAFGMVLGWFVYFTNRYRKGDAQFSDLTGLIGVIGGGAITALFGDAKTELFGAYGVGLAVGFFTYFLVLILMVRQSQGAFTVAWFLDGRRKKLAADEEIPGETRPTTAAMSMQLGANAQHPAALAAPIVPPARPAASALSETVQERDRAMIAMNDAIRDVLKRIANTDKEDERNRLYEAHDQMTAKYDELVAVRLKDILESESVRQALAKLQGVTTDLVGTAREMKNTADAISTAAKIIDKATKVIGFLSAMFA
ncbi:hypothetical protein [Pseudomonas izuensis]|uniref:hypothetical protein n=1 Tax=Pseudomonas izuensis TaxID=2684212 RepID=UPI0015B43D55|nr:hypothetical protein [Pseudomonas izuensis]